MFTECSLCAGHQAVAAMDWKRLFLPRGSPCEGGITSPGVGTESCGCRGSSSSIYRQSRDKKKSKLRLVRTSGNQTKQCGDKNVPPDGCGGVQICLRSSTHSSRKDLSTTCCLPRTLEESELTLPSGHSLGLETIYAPWSLLARSAAFRSCPGDAAEQVS